MTARVFETIAETGEKVGAIARFSHSPRVNRETLRQWVRQPEVDAGQRAGAQVRRYRLGLGSDA